MPGAVLQTDRLPCGSGRHHDRCFVPGHARPKSWTLGQVEHGAGFYPESRTLPLDWLRFHVGYDEVVGVRLYDEGGATRFAPALYLLEVAHQDTRRTLLKCGEAFAFGVTLGAGGAAGAAGAAGGRLATALVWCDRAAVALGVFTSVVDEHRAWILERYGEKGARFLRYSDGVSTLVAFYAVGRLATAA